MSAGVAQYEGSLGLVLQTSVILMSISGVVPSVSGVSPSGQIEMQTSGMQYPEQPSSTGTTIAMEVTGRLTVKTCVLHSVWMNRSFASVTDQR